MDDPLINMLEKRIGTLEKQIKDMIDLRRLMNTMKHTLSEVKINIDELKEINDALKFTLQVKELDEWTLQTLKTFKKISEEGGFRVLKGEKPSSPKTLDFINFKKAQQGLIERGIEVLPKFEGEINKILNLSVAMALDFLASKEIAIEAAQALIGPYRKSEAKEKE